VPSAPSGTSGALSWLHDPSRATAVTAATIHAVDVRRCRGAIGGNILAAMGMNPFRPHRSSPVADVLFVGAALVVCALLVAWAFFG
jgi:hypothetical protein